MTNVLTKLRDILDRYGFLPKFTEDQIFLMVVALGVIYFIDPSSQAEIFDTLYNSEKATLIAGAGLLLTIYTAFFTRFKTETQKHYILWFALIINLVVGVTALSVISEKSLSLIWYIFPLLNIISFFLVVLFWHTGLYNTGRITTKSMSYENIIYGSLALTFIAFVLNSVPNTSWQVIFSSSIAYATLFSGTVTKYLPRIFSSKIDKSTLIQKLIIKNTTFALQTINRSGFKYNQIAISTLTKDEILNIPDDRLGEIELFVNEMAISKYKEEDFASGAMGTYEWKQSWWSKTKTFTSLITDVYLVNENKRYEFCQTLEENETDFRLGDRGLIYQSAYPR